MVWRWTSGIRFGQSVVPAHSLSPSVASIVGQSCARNDERRTLTYPQVNGSDGYVDVARTLPDGVTT